jgi:outer membrane protein assembly factor BamD
VGLGRTVSFALLLSAVPVFGAEDFGDGEPSRAFAAGMALEEAGKLMPALRCYRTLARDHAQSDEAPAALHRRGMIFFRQNRYRRAFRCLDGILDKYPDYSDYMNVLELEFQVAQSLMEGKRNYLLWGKIPGFRDRTAAREYFKKIVERVPYCNLAPEALLNVAILSLRMREPDSAIEALERLVDEYGDSPVAPEALLLLAKVYRERVPGPSYDQKMTREAINSYQEFLILFPDSPLAPQAEEGLAETTELLAAGKINVGDFYYDDRQNPSGAKPYYEEALQLAPRDSPTAQRAERRLADIREEKPGKGSPLDFIMGRYRSPVPADAHGQK